MSIDYDAIMLDPLYELVHGIEATFVSRDHKTADLIVIDKTEGVEGDPSSLALQGPMPAVCVRVSELEAQGLDRADMSGGRLTFAGQSWGVESTKPKPKPGSKGELTLFLQERDDG